MLGDELSKQCIYSITRRSLPVIEAIKEKVDYCRSQPPVNSSYVIEYETADESFLAILSEIVFTRTGNPCDQKSVLIRLIYEDKLNEFSVEVVITNLCVYPTGMYSLHGVFKQVKDDV